MKTARNSGRRCELPLLDQYSARRERHTLEIYPQLFHSATQNYNGRANLPVSRFGNMRRPLGFGGSLTLPIGSAAILG